MATTFRRTRRPRCGRRDSSASHLARRHRRMAQRTGRAVVPHVDADALGNARPTQDRPHRMPVAASRRFIDPSAEFHYVPSAEVRAFAEANAATPYDVPGVAYTHDGAQCSFDAFIRLHALRTTRRSPISRRSCARPIPARPNLRRRRQDCSPCRSGCRPASPTITRCCAGACSCTTPAVRVVPPRKRRATRAAEREGTAMTEPRARTPERAARRYSSNRRTARAHPRRGVPLLAAAGLLELRRTGGPDRADASRTGRREALDFRAALPACAQLLHGAAGSGGAAARDLHRLADAPHVGRHRRRRRCSCCRRSCC